jgi:serine/threonine protein kinase
MTYCVNPGCQHPQNPDDANHCQGCGWQLRLRDRYRPVQKIGQGGFGRTFLTVDEDIPSKPLCVTKQLYLHQGSTGAHEKAVQLFHQEAVQLDQLGRHPQIPSLLAHFEQDQQLYLVQEYVEGQTLLQEFRQNGVFTELQVWQLLQELLPVLKFVHEQQVVHRDIKPANIMRRSGDGKLVLIDFGIAKLFAGAALMETGTIIGTPDYMAPEQTRGKALPASDLYSLGLTCIHLLTGISPSSLFDLMTEQWRWRDYLPTSTSVGNAPSVGFIEHIRLGQVLDKMLQNSLKQRYLSAVEVLQALNAPTVQPTKATPAPVATPSKSTAVAAKKLTISPQKSQPSNPSFLNRVLRRFGYQPQPVSNDVLNSKVGIDYTQLQTLLIQRKWKEADRETKALICMAAGKRVGGYLFPNEIPKIACEDLQTIDRLWVKYSAGRFGLSVQTRIFEELDRDYGSFCEQVGWPAHLPPLPDAGMIYSLKAPVGHLPSRSWVGGTRWWDHAGVIANKLHECNIC